MKYIMDVAVRSILNNRLLSYSEIEQAAIITISGACHGYRYGVNSTGSLCSPGKKDENTTARGGCVLVTFKVGV